MIGTEGKTSLEEHRAFIFQHLCVVLLELGATISHEPADVAAATSREGLLTKAMKVFQREAALMANDNHTPKLLMAKNSKRVGPPPPHLHFV